MMNFWNNTQKHHIDNGPLALNYIIKLKTSYEKLGFEDIVWAIDEHLRNTKKYSQ